MVTIYMKPQSGNRNIPKMLSRSAIAFGVLALVAIPGSAQLTQNESKPVVGDSLANPGPLDAALSPELTPAQIQKVMRKVGDWQIDRVSNAPSQDWTFAALYMGLLSASKTLQDSRYHDLVLRVAEHYHWTLGPREGHADDQAIGHVYLELYRENRVAKRILPMRQQFDTLLTVPDDPQKPVWWWCDALFMAPPVWAGLTRETDDPRYLDYMDREWRITSNLLWDSKEHLFSRDATYLHKTEKNGRKVFWSRGNGWVMGGLVAVLEQMPANDPRRPFYVEKLKQMSSSIAAIQGSDGLWRAGLLDAASYSNPELSGSAFFVYAMTWGVRHGYLDAATYVPVIGRAWGGMLGHVYQDGRLGDIQPVGEAPGAYGPSSSYVFGVGAFLLAGSELNAWASEHPVARNAIRTSHTRRKGTHE